MPLILKKNTGCATLLLWSADEGEERLRMLVTEDDRASVADFASPTRRIERLAWRAALRTVIPDGDIAYTENGAPFIVGSSRHIGVAHTRGLAAVIVSEGKCAIDVECTGRDFARSRARFISPEEDALLDAVHIDFTAAVWCAKETMYKYSDRRGFDFLSDLRITDCNLSHGTMQGQIEQEEVNLCVHREGKYLIVYTQS